jgi:hypothetical protein
MSDHYFSEKRDTHLIFWVTGHMLRGAGIAAVFLIGIYLVLWVIQALGMLLPDASKEAPDPNTWSAYEAPLIETAA